MAIECEPDVAPAITPVRVAIESYMDGFRRSSNRRICARSLRDLAVAVINKAGDKASLELDEVMRLLRGDMRAGVLYKGTSRNVTFFEVRG
jgi:hypothetical protein